MYYIWTDEWMDGWVDEWMDGVGFDNNVYSIYKTTLCSQTQTLAFLFLSVLVFKSISRANFRRDGARDLFSI